jgi:hypothetical protein
MSTITAYNVVIGLDLESVCEVVEAELGWLPVGHNPGYWMRDEVERVSFIETAEDLESYDRPVTVYLVQGFRDSPYWEELETVIDAFGVTVLDL